MTPIEPPSPYAPPKAIVGESVQEPPAFYVVATRKFWWLYMATLGLYQIYWFYEHWARFKARHRDGSWPVMRALFAIFFAHGLNREIDGALQKSGRSYRWSPGLMATGYVLMSIASAICSQLSAKSIGWPYTDVLGLLLLLPVGVYLGSAQRAANVACGDPDGQGNARMTGANIAWLVAGALLWVLLLVGMLVPEPAA